jgi:type II secretory pathway component GspD/PulD (secretin)/tetratricopeptide (TPR) repeat protein
MFPIRHSGEMENPLRSLSYIKTSQATRRRVALCSRLVPVLVGVLFASTAALANVQQADTLRLAIEHYDAGEYQDAQQLLAGMDVDALNDEDRELRDEYLSRVQVALVMYEKAVRDLDDAEAAMDEGESDKARRFLQSVLFNEHAAEAVRRSARAMLADLDDADRAAQPQPAVSDASPPSAASPPAATTMPAPRPPSGVSPQDVERARMLTRDGDMFVNEGRFEQALQAYQQALAVVPGYPEAVDGLRRVQLHIANIQGAQGESLIEQIRRNDLINWQRAVAEYRDVEQRILAQVAAEKFEEAGQLLVRARQIVESARQFADPVTKYESLRSEVDALSAWVRQEERQFNERKVAEIRRQIEEERATRLRLDEENRKRQVDALMSQAMQHRRDGELDEAIAVLRQITVIDPREKSARWMLDELEDLRQQRKARSDREDFYEQAQRALQDVEVAKIPWHMELQYPDNWPEITASPERRGPGATGRDRRLFGALDRQVPIDFRGLPFEQVIERFADANRVNIIVNWNDLKRAGVERTAPVALSLPNEVSLRKAITEVLEQVGGSDVELGFDVADGAVKIATRSTLDRETFTAVYDIQDLLMEVPNFNDSPTSDLTQTYQRGRRNAADSHEGTWRNVEEENDDRARDKDRQARVNKIVELIQETVAPESWVERGGTIGTIRELNGQLVITQNSASQQQIGNLLGKLREQRAIQIAVEARFITVSSHYLEELGMDIDVVLNAGNAGFDFIPTGQGPLTDPVLGSTALLPRSFSRIGITPATPGQGVAMPQTPAQLAQPFGNPALVPQRGGGSGSNFSPIPIATNTLNLTNPANLGSDVPGSFAGQVIPPAFSLFGSFLDNIQVDFLIRATQADSRTTVLTAPRLVLFNGQRSWVAVTIQQGFVSQLDPVVATGAVAQAPQTGVIDSGAVLDVSATVSADRRYVTMTVRPGVTRLLDLQTIPFSGGAGGGGFAGGAATPAFIQLPTLSSQRVQTTVSVPDGGTLLIGGQKLASETEVEAGVPVLSKIPILKRAYSSRSMVKDEQTLLILIKPKIFIQTEQEELAFPTFGAAR